MKTIYVILGAFSTIIIVLGLLALITHPEFAPIWGDVATWVTGLTTIALFIVGFIQIQNERMARIKSKQEHEDLLMRSQAEQISAWLEKETRDDHGQWQWVAIMNQSTQPVYNTIVTIVALTQSGMLKAIHKDRICINIVPPGLGYISFNDVVPPSFGRLGVEIAFKDILGTNWVRGFDGRLVQLEQSTLEFYNIALPTSWVDIEKELPQDNR